MVSFQKKTINSFENKKQNLLYSLSLDHPVLHPSYHMTPKGKKSKTNANRDLFQERQRPGPRKETTEKPTEIYYAWSYARSDCQLLPCHVSYCEKPYVTGTDLVVYITTFRFLIIRCIFSRLKWDWLMFRWTPRGPLSMLAFIDDNMRIKYKSARHEPRRGWRNAPDGGEPHCSDVAPINKPVTSSTCDTTVWYRAASSDIGFHKASWYPRPSLLF